MASAAILGRELLRRGIPATQYRSVDFNDGGTWSGAWPSAAGTEPFAVVDFLYHEHALAWLDHHPTTFSGDLREHYEQRLIAGDLVVWDASKPSCARLVAEWSRTLPNFTATVAAADKIDQAAYASVDEYYFSTDPAILINHCNSDLTEQQREGIISGLAQDDIESALWTVRDLARETQARRQYDLDIAEKYTTRRGRLAITDCVAGTIGHARFAALAMYPDADYHATLYLRDRAVSLSVGINPWKSVTNTIPLGAWLRNRTGLYTPAGGGHPYAAGFSLSSTQHSNPHQECWAIINDLAAHLNA